MNYSYERYWGLFYLGAASPQGELSTSKIVGVGYSGNNIYLNEPMYDYLIDSGCLPDGRYSLDGPFTDSEKGPICFNLIPAPTNNMKNRSAFMIHGDNQHIKHTASDGCIVAPPWTRSVFKDGDILDVI